ncbi:MAG: hypothetical protein NTW87_03690 [Planctomycetota bacterium]|nr:hypothetical protein [Planctomycetota bacterium]
MAKLCSFSLALLAGLVLTGAVASAGEPKTMTTRQLLAKFVDDLKSVWEKYGTVSQKAVREQTVNELNTSFTKDIRDAEVPKNLRLQKALDFYLSGLENSPSLFPVEKVRNERNLYVRGCSACYKREYMQAADYADARTTQQCFDMLMKNMEQVRDTLAREQYKEIRAEAYGIVNSLFAEQIQAATVPEKVDPADQMDKNMKEARARFPVSVKVLADTNTPALSAVEAAAKRVAEKAKQRK